MSKTQSRESTAWTSESESNQWDESMGAYSSMAKFRMDFTVSKHTQLTTGKRFGERSIASPECVL